jgi:hypothetical protein
LIYIRFLKEIYLMVQTTAQTPVELWPLTLLRRAWAYNRFITLAALLQITLIPLLLIAWVVDAKTILGMPAWVKPLKFAVSGAIYTFTFVWLLTYVQRFRWLKQIAASVTGLALLAETGLVTMQVVRGTMSHFNEATPFDSAVFDIMGGLIMPVAVLNLLLSIGLLFQRLPDPVFAWGLRWGVVISFVGMAVAFLMVDGPTPSQLQRLEAGERVHYIGGHSVGVEDGGPGLPLLGWSTEGGDLRAPHFFGLHGMQLLPIAGWMLARPALRQRLSTPRRLVLIWTVGLGYLGLIAILTWQALRGQPIIAPDEQTWLALGSLVVVVLAVVVATVANKSAESLRLAPRRVQPASQR